MKTTTNKETNGVSDTFPSIIQVLIPIAMGISTTILYDTSLINLYLAVIAIKFLDVILNTVFKISTIASNCAKSYLLMCNLMLCKR